MSLGILFLVISFLAISADIPNFEGNYYMPILRDGNQYVFNIGWSDARNRYVVTIIGQALSWVTASLTVINDTTIELLTDDGNTLLGNITFKTDFPTICWPTEKDFTCWNRLLSNITRIHVINM
jgi:hypothetical protein